MKFESKEALAAYFRENPNLKRLELNNCPGITSLPALPNSLTDLLVDSCPGIACGGGLQLGKLWVEIR
jgi:hypothetical protein